MNARFARKFGGLLVGVAAVASALLPTSASATTTVAAPVMHHSISPGTVGIPIGGTEKVYATISNTGTAAATKVVMNMMVLSNDRTPPRLVGFTAPSAVTWNGMSWTWHVGTVLPGHSAVLGIAVHSYARLADSVINYHTSGTGPTGSWGVCDNHACEDYVHIVSPMPTVAYIAVTRQGSAVYVNSLVKQYSTAWSAAPARTVYVQRLVRGVWQTILSRTTNSIGRITVGFIQPNPLTYRVYVGPTSSAAAAYSGGAVG